PRQGCQLWSSAQAPVSCLAGISVISDGAMMNTSYPESAATSAAHPGEALRVAREARGWLKSDVAMQLHLSTDALTHLETGEFDKLPGLIFARGYVRAYAKLLGLDQNQLVHDFDVMTG